MNIQQIWTGNRARNFNYVVGCPETGEAIAIDPCDDQKCLATAESLGWKITQVLNTHEHADHISGNQRIVDQTGAELLAPSNAAHSIPAIDWGLVAGDKVKVGRSGTLQVMETPGHTLSHICLLGDEHQPVLFSGDLLFNAGVGNCRNGGDPQTLFETISTQINSLSDRLVVYPGHDYLENNLRFTIAREPDNQTAIEMLAGLGSSYDPSNPIVTTLGLERQINVFLRLENEQVIAGVHDSFPDLPDDADSQRIFLALRQLRDAW